MKMLWAHRPVLGAHRRERVVCKRSCLQSQVYSRGESPQASASAATALLAVGGRGHCRQTTILRNPCRDQPLSPPLVHCAPVIPVTLHKLSFFFNINTALLIRKKSKLTRRFPIGAVYEQHCGNEQVTSSAEEATSRYLLQRKRLTLVIP